MLVSKIIVKIVLKLYGENSPSRDYQLQYICGLRIIFSTLKVLMSLIDTNLMIATINMHEKNMWSIANCSTHLYNSREISIHFVMKIIEIDSYSERKLTQNQELSIKVVLRQKAIKSGFHLNFLITVIKHPSTLHSFLKVWCYEDILILKNQSKQSFPEFYRLFKSAV